MNSPSNVFRTTILAYLVMSLFCSVSATADDDIRLLENVPYKSGETTEYERQRCKLDLYLPEDTQGFATIVWFHGGGLQNGDKSGKIARAFGRRFAQEGIAVATANYRLHPRAEYPAYLEDAAAAFSFVRQMISKHGGSPNRVFVSGHSAGGYLTAMIGADASFLARHNLSLDSIAGLMPVSGQMITHTTVRVERGIPKARPLIDSAAPTYHVQKDTPPFLVVVGGQDLPARAEENRYFVAAMKAAGHSDVTYLEVQGRNHSTIANQIAESDDLVADAMIAFIERLGR